MSSDVRAKIIVSLLCAVFASVFGALYVWQDWPGASDAGNPTLSGWLVDTFGRQSARSMGIAIFSGLALLLFAVFILCALRWRTAKGEE